LSLNGCQLKYGIHIKFLIYYIIVSAIPRRWKFEIKKHYSVVDVSILNWPLRIVLKQSQGCRSIYNDLIEQSYSNITPNEARKLNEWFPGGLPLGQWQNSFDGRIGQIETLPHLLVECEVVKLFWIDIQLWLYERTDILIDLNVREIIIGFQDETFIMFNAVYLLGKKMYIKMFPNLTAFQKIITQFLLMLVEKSIAMRNSKITEFKNMWSIE